MEAMLAFREFQLGVIADRRAKPPQDDLVSILCYAEIDGERLDDESIIQESLLILIGGDETSRHVMTDGMLALLEHPDQLAILRDDPAAIEVGVEELLRWVSPIKNMARTVTRDVELHGQTLHEGDQVILMYPAANRDPSVFEDPDAFRRAPRPEPAPRVRLRSALLHGCVARPTRAEGDVLRAAAPPARPAPRRRPAPAPARRTSSPDRKRCRSRSRPRDLIVQRAPGLAFSSSNRPLGRMARYAATTGASSVGVAPCMITPSTPRSNWRSTRSAHVSALPVADGSSHSSGSSVAMCSSVGGVGHGVDRARHRLHDLIGAEARRAHRDPIRWFARGDRRSPGGTSRAGRPSSSAATRTGTWSRIVA